LILLEHSFLAHLFLAIFGVKVTWRTTEGRPRVQIEPPPRPSSDLFIDNNNHNINICCYFACLIYRILILQINMYCYDTFIETKDFNFSLLDITDTSIDLGGPCSKKASTNALPIRRLVPVIRTTLSLTVYTIVSLDDEYYFSLTVTSATYLFAEMQVLVVLLLVVVVVVKIY
jgi:hypothetical protein